MRFVFPDSYFLESKQPLVILLLRDRIRPTDRITFNKVNMQKETHVKLELPLSNFFSLCYCAHFFLNLIH